MYIVTIDESIGSVMNNGFSKLLLFTKNCKTLHRHSCIKFFVRFMVFNVTFNDISVISWQSVLLGEETGVVGNN